MAGRRICRGTAALALLALAGCWLDSDQGPSDPLLAYYGLRLETAGTLTCEANREERVKIGEIRLKGTSEVIRPHGRFVRFELPAGVEVLADSGATRAEAADGTVTGYWFRIPSGPDAEAVFDVFVNACPPEDSPGFRVDLSVTDDADDSGTLSSDEQKEVRVRQHVKLHVEDPGGSGTPPPPALTLPALAVYDSIARAPEGMAFLLSSFYLQNLAPWLILSGSDRTAVIDPETGEPVARAGSLPSAEGDFGAVWLEHVADPSAGGAATLLDDESAGGLFTYGPGGGTFHPWADGDWSGMVHLAFFTEFVTDAWYYANADGREAILVSHGGISSYAWDPETKSFVRYDHTVSYSTIPGNVVTAVAMSRSGPRLAVTDGQPGALYVHSGGDADAGVKVGDVGDDPRRIRGVGDLFAVGNFGGDSLTLVRWDGGSSPVIESTVAVGDGPVGIDVREIAGVYAIVSTGFNDGTYSITLVDRTTHEVLRNESFAVPAGVTNPGHAIWLDDTHVAITGNTSDSVAVIEVSASVE